MSPGFYSHLQKFFVTVSSCSYQFSQAKCFTNVTHFYSYKCEDSQFSIFGGRGLLNKIVRQTRHAQNCIHNSARNGAFVLNFFEPIGKVGPPVATKRGCDWSFGSPFISSRTKSVLFEARVSTEGFGVYRTQLGQFLRFLLLLRNLD